MNDTATGLDQTDEEILFYDVSDDAVEAAAEGVWTSLSKPICFCGSHAVGCGPR
jgi:hypothetical protein